MILELARTDRQHHHGPTPASRPMVWTRQDRVRPSPARTRVVARSGRTATVDELALVTDRCVRHPRVPPPTVDECRRSTTR